MARRIALLGLLFGLVLGATGLARPTATRAASPPVVTKVSPDNGYFGGGTAITITGSGFTGATSVNFNTIAGEISNDHSTAPSFTVISDTTITATTPHGSTEVDVTVTTPNGTSAVNEPGDEFAFVSLPTVTAISPSGGTPTGGTVVTIGGTGFFYIADEPTVMFGPNAATNVQCSFSTCTATSPAGLSGQTYDVTVTTGAGTSAVNAGGCGTGTTPCDQFTYDFPRVDSISPAAGSPSGGTTVSITGINFSTISGEYTIYFWPDDAILYSNPASSANCDSSTHCTAVSPPQPAGTRVHVVVVVDGSTQTSANGAFLYAQQPVVSSVTPASGPPSGATSVTIGGDLFGTGDPADTHVSFGSTPATNVVTVNNQEITATSPAGSGAVDVTVTTPGGTSALSGTSCSQPGTFSAPCDAFAYQASQASPTLTTTPGGPVVAGSGAKLTDSATLSGGSSPTGTITFTLVYNGSTVDTEIATVHGNGVYNTPNGYTLPTTGTVTGVYQWNATYSGDTNNLTASDTNNPNERVTVSAASTALTYTGPTIGDYNDAVSVIAALYDPTDNTPIAGKSVTFTLGSGAVAPTCTGTTDNSGNALCSLTPNEAAGPYTLTASFAGDANYAPSPTSVPFTVRLEDTALAYTGPTSGNDGAAVTLTATLTDPTDTTPIPNETIAFSIGSQSCAGTTNAQGNASCSITLSQAAGPYTATAAFTGDPNYLSSSASAPFTILLDPTTTTVSCNLSTMLVNQATTCTATVTDSNSSPTTPTGPVSFLSNGPGGFSANACTPAAVANSSSQASCSVSFTPSANGPLASPAGLPTECPTGQTSSTLFAGFGGDASHGPSCGATGVTVNLRSTSTSVACNPSNLTIGRPTQCVATVTDTATAGTAVTPLGDVTFTTSGGGTFSATPCSGGPGSGPCPTSASLSCSLVAASGGSSSCYVFYTPSAGGTQTITASYGGDEAHASSSGQTNLMVQAPTTTAAASASATYGDASVTLNATVSAASATVNEGSVSFSVLDASSHLVGSATSGAVGNGAAQVSYALPTGTAPGTYAIQASYTDSAGSFTASNNSGQSPAPTLNISKATTALVYGSPASGDYNDAVSVSATLSDATHNLPLQGKTVSFMLGSGSNAPSCTGTTTTSGTASCSLTPNQAAGPYALTVSFAGDSDYAPSSVSPSFTVSLEESKLIYTGRTAFAAGSPATLTATLTDPTDNTPVAGKTISFTLGSQSCSGTTDTSGAAGCTISAVSQSAGSITVTASFAGDSDYKPASDSKPAFFAAFANSSGASFTLGDKTVSAATSSTTLTFSSGDWSTLNSLSGGAAPASFKGYADAPGANQPTCGGHFSAGAGNSAHPPTSVPSLLAVFVSTNVSKSGATISGDIAHIVVVQTDSSHPGTGKIVATIC